jgi:hypothetical protein
VVESSWSFICNESGDAKAGFLFTDSLSSAMAESLILSN